MRNDDHPLDDELAHDVSRQSANDEHHTQSYNAQTSRQVLYLLLL